AAGIAIVATLPLVVVPTVAVLVLLGLVLVTLVFVLAALALIVLARGHRVRRLAVRLVLLGVYWGGGRQRERRNHADLEGFHLWAPCLLDRPKRPAGLSVPAKAGRRGDSRLVSLAV